MSLNSFARNGNITGKIVNKEKEPVDAASIVLLQKDGKTLVKSALTDEQGNFVFENIADGEYVVKAMYIGYEQYSDNVIVGNSNVTLNEIALSPKGGTLKEVTVRGQKPFIEVFADKLVVNVENSIVSAGSSVMDVLQRSPGVTVDNNDNIALKGRQGVIIMINGKPTPMQGQDLANVLKSMPSNSIERIELISNPGARYDAAGTAGIINIITKKDQRLGMNGSANASYAQGIYPKYNAGINLNYRDKKFNVSFNYSYAYRYWFNHLMLFRQFLDTAKNDAQQFAYDQDNYALFDFSNHIAGLSFDYNLTSKTTVGIAVTGITNTFQPKADNRSRALGPDDEVLYNFNTTGRHKNSFANYSLNLNLRHTFDTTGKELSVDADYAGYKSQSNQSFLTQYIFPNNGSYIPDYYLKSDLSGLTQISSIKADYTNPLRSKASFSFGVKSSYVVADNEPLFWDNRNGGNEADVYDSSRSNHFIYKENINAAYANFNKEWEKWGMQLGVRMENTNATADQITLNQKYNWNYTQLFPSIALQRHVNPKNDIGITLSRRIERPNYQQLNPFKYFIDKTTYREGYPYLQPALSYNIELSHTFKQRFITTATYSVTNDVIAEVIQPSDTEDSITVQTNKNLTRMRYYGLSGAYPIQITRWWSNVTNFNAYYAHYEGFIANTNLSNGSPAFTIHTNNTFILPKDFSAELGFWYQSRQIYAYMDLEDMWMLNAGIQKNLFDKRATIRLAAQDIFWQGFPSATSEYVGYKESFVAERETRTVTLSFTYRFGKKTVAPVRRRTGGAEDLKNRAGNGM